MPTTNPLTAAFERAITQQRAPSVLGRNNVANYQRLHAQGLVSEGTMRSVLTKMGWRCVQTERWVSPVRIKKPARKRGHDYRIQSDVVGVRISKCSRCGQEMYDVRGEVTFVMNGMELDVEGRCLVGV